METWAGRTINHVKTRLRRSQKCGRKTIRSQHYESHSFRAGPIFIWFSSKRPFSIILDKVFKPANKALDVSLKLLRGRDWFSAKTLKCLWSEICFCLVLKFTLSNTRFQSLRRLELKRTILQAKVNNSLSFQSWAFCLPKMVRRMGRVNPKIPRRDVTLVPNFSLHNQSFLSARSVYMRKMSSDSEMSDLSERSSNWQTEEEEDEDVQIIYSQLTPYQKEPLAEVDTSDNTRDANDIEEGESTAAAIVVLF